MATIAATFLGGVKWNTSNTVNGVHMNNVAIKKLKGPGY